MVVDDGVGADVRNAHAAHQYAFDPAVGRGHERLLDQRQRRGYARSLPRLVSNLLPIAQAPVIALNDGVTVEADDLVEQLGPEAVHHAHDDDQGGDAQRYGADAEAGNDEDEALALGRQQITAGEHSLVAGEDHAVSLARADSMLN